MDFNETTDWTCSCGSINNGNFCGNCGKSKPITKENTSWTCSCGTVNKTNFCTNCGKEKAYPITQVKQEVNYIEVTLDEDVLEQLGFDKNCSSFDIPETYNYNGKNYKITKIGDRAFVECTSLESITIPNSVTKIGLCAFGVCSSLKSITIPDSVTEIGIVYLELVLL